ncbi:MAG: rod shape-determining protein RodA [Synechococcales cyanobacterium]
MGASPRHSFWFTLGQQWQQSWRDFDGSLLLTVLTLTAFGIIGIRSASSRPELWIQQLVMVGVSLVPCLLLARLPYDRWLRWHWFTYGISLISLVAVMFVGVSAGGAERWIMVGGFQLQPSEFAKVAVILSLAAVLHHWPIKYFSQIWVVVGVIIPPWILIFLQPNLGTSLVFLFVLGVMLYWGGAKASWLLLIISPLVGAILFGLHTKPHMDYMLPIWLGWIFAMAVLAFCCLSWRWLGALVFGGLNLISGQLGQVAWGILKPYQKARLVIFMDPAQDPLGSGYHLIQSKIAIGAGGLWGRGLMQGTQTQLDFIPEQHTDFIFSAIGEELGFVGAGVVLLLLWFLCLRLVILAQTARDNFGSLIAMGVLAMILFQSLVNIGMTIGLAPITGIPLPFLSYGRSAILTNFLALGLVESVAKHRQRVTFFT